MNQVCLLLVSLAGVNHRPAKLSSLMMIASNCSAYMWRTKQPVSWPENSNNYIGCFLKTCFGYSCYALPFSFTFRFTSIPGSDVSKAGTKTSAKGTVTGAGKKAVGEMLDGQIADLRKDIKDKTNKTPKEKGPKDPKAEEAKKLQKDMKAFLGKLQRILNDKNISIPWSLESTIIPITVLELFVQFS